VVVAPLPVDRGTPTNYISAHSESDGVTREADMHWNETLSSVTDVRTRT